MASSADHDQDFWRHALKAHMVRLNLSARKLSLRAGLNATAVRDLLVGRARSPRYETLLKITQALGISPDDLAYHDPTNKRSSELCPRHCDVLTAFFTGLFSVDRNRNAVNDRYPAPRVLAEQVMRIVRAIDENPTRSCQEHQKEAFDSALALSIPRDTKG